MGSRYFELAEDGGATQFWEVWLEGTDVRSRWGRVGSPGQTGTLSLGSDDEARQVSEDLAKEKVAQGFVEKAQNWTEDDDDDVPTERPRPIVS